MQTATSPRLNASPNRRASLLPPRPITINLMAPAFGVELDRDRGFVAMLRGYKESGGLGRGDEVAERFKAAGHDVAWLARWIVERQVLSFEWRSELWLPWFQFNPADMSLRKEPQLIGTELTATFDAWHLSKWFIEPSCWLNNRRPVEVLRSDPNEVLHAARTDRFVALG